MKKLELTKKDLLNLGIVDVNYLENTFTRKKILRKSSAITTTEPSIIALCSDNGEVRYIGLTTSLYIPETKTYKNYPYHKLVYAWYYGYVPTGTLIYHIDGNPMNNSPKNLALSSEMDKVAKRWNLTTEEIKGKSLLELKKIIDKKIYL